MNDRPTPPAGDGTLPMLDMRRHALFFDFDGTLAPIVPRPNDAAMAKETAEILSVLSRATDGAVAVITGRALDDVLPRFHPLDLAAAGSHGVEFRLPGADTETDALSSALAGPGERLKAHAEARGLLIEHKPGSVALHYRARPEEMEATRAAVEAEVATDPALRAIHGDMVSEVALATISKGTALKRLMEHAPFAGRVPVMAGDDVTDEDGFAAAAELGGFGIRIGGIDSCARYRVPKLDHFLDWLAVQARMAGQDISTG